MSHDFDKFEQIPNSVLKNITPQPKVNTLDNITGNTDNAAAQITDSFPNDFGKYNAQENPPGGQPNFTMPGQQPGQTLNAGNLINPELAVNLMDTVMPTALVLIMRNTMQKVVNKNAFTLTNSEKKTLEPVIQACLNSINFNVQNPWNALILVMGMTYGMKTIEVLNNVPTGKSVQPISPVVAASTGALKKDNRGRPAGSKNKKHK